MRQRLGIAQALIGRPTLLIVDEPTAGLDPEERVRFHNLLGETAGEDAVVILSTHIVSDVSSLCSHMAIIKQGEYPGVYYAVASGQRVGRISLGSDCPSGQGRGFKDSLPSPLVTDGRRTGAFESDFKQRASGRRIHCCHRSSRRLLLQSRQH